jgi:hypothetical protein
MNPELIPALDAAPIPGPAWLFHVLLVLTFFLHVLFLNLTLGGTLLAAVGQLLSGGKPVDPRAVMAGRLMGINTFGISLTITTGVAPLLFVQVLYQQYFYTATILIASVWLAMLLLLMLGYYAAYLYKFKGAPARGKGGTLWLVIAAVLFFAIAMVQVAVNLIHAQPGKWAALAENPWGVLGDPAYWPRLLHFLLASVAFSALVVTWWAVRRARAGEEVELNTGIARFAWSWVLWATVLQLVDGFVLLFVLPREVLVAVMNGGAGTLLPLGLAILLGIGLIAMIARASNPVEQPALVTGVLGAMTLVIAVMAITRHQVRALYLAPVRGDVELATAPQWGNFVLFAVLLVVALATVAYMVKATLANPASGEEAA